MAEKRRFFENYDRLDAKGKKELESQRLDFVFDTFPLSADDPDRTFYSRFTKVQLLERNRMNFYNKPDFVIEEIFFNVMNGRSVENRAKD